LSQLTRELAALRVPETRPVAEPVDRALRRAAERWRASRVDVAENTRTRHALELGRIKPRLGDRRIDEITPGDVAAFVAALAEEGYARGTIRKTLQTLAMILDYAAVTPNPARDKHVRLPREEPEEINPPTAVHLESVFRLLPPRHRLAFLFLDWSGARVSAIDLTLVSDYDEPRRRVRLRAATTKTRRALWVELPPTLADALEQQLGPPEDRNPDARLFAGSGADALRTSIGKACRAAGVPCSRLTISGTGESASCTCAAFLGRGSASSSASGTCPLQRTSTATFSATRRSSITPACSAEATRCRPRCRPPSVKPRVLQAASIPPGATTRCSERRP